VGVCAEALGEEPLRLRSGLKLLNMAQLLLTSDGVFCACSSSWSGGQGDGPGLHAWDLLLWVDMSGILPLLMLCGSLGGVFLILLVSLPLVGVRHTVLRTNVPFFP